MRATPEPDAFYMRRALELASRAAECGEVPVGAVVVRSGTILAEAHNLRESLHDPTAHAERLALADAGRALKSWRLDGCTLYVTLEPCVMCAGAIVLSRPDRVVFGALDPKAGALQSLYRIASDPRLNHRPAVLGLVLAAESSELLARFFRDRRP